MYWWTDEVDRGVKGLTCRGFYGLVFEGEGGVWRFEVVTASDGEEAPVGEREGAKI